MYLATARRDARSQVAAVHGRRVRRLPARRAGGRAGARASSLLDLVPHPRPELKYLFEIVGGVVLLTLAAVLFSFRALLSKREAAGGLKPTAGLERDPRRDDHRRSSYRRRSPTSRRSRRSSAPATTSGTRSLLIVIFNVAFVLPLLAIIGILQFAGNNANRVLTGARAWLERHWPAALAAIGLIAGLFCVFIGVTGLIGLHHSHAGRVARRLRRIVAH